MGLREEKKERTRTEILRAAEDRFRSVGFEATRIRDLAAGLHLSEQTLFNYFPSKGALLDALAVQWFAGLEARTRLEPTPSVEDFLSGVRDLLRAIADDRDYMRLVFTRAPILRDLARSAPPPVFARNLARLGEVFAAQQREGALRSDVPAEEIAEYYVTLFNAAVTRWLASGSDDATALEARVDRALRVLFRGLAPEGDAP